MTIKNIDVASTLRCRCVRCRCVRCRCVHCRCVRFAVAVYAVAVYAVAVYAVAMKQNAQELTQFITKFITQFITQFTTLEQIPLYFDKINNVVSDYTNWVIPGRLMCGPSPLTMGNAAMDIIADGINTIVCLQKETKYTEYLHLFKNSENLEFLQVDIDDNKVPSYREFIVSVTKILTYLKDGRNVYIHCHGGHGRTGLYVIAILACVYKELRTKELALHYAQHTHDLRRKQVMHFYGMLPARVAENKCQQELLDDFFALLRFL